MRKLFWRLSLCAAAVVSIYGMRQFFIGTAVEFALRHATGETVAFEQRTLKNGKLIYDGFSLGEDFQAQQVTFACDFQLSPLSFTPKIDIQALSIQLDNNKAEPGSLAFLIPTKYTTVKLNVKDGLLSCQDGTTYPFEFTSGSSSEEIGFLTTSLFNSGFTFTDGNLAVDLEMEEASLSQTVRLVSLFYPVPQWNRIEGVAAAHLHTVFGTAGLSIVQGDFQLQNGRWESEEVIGAVDDARGQVDFQSGIDTLALNSQFQGFDLFWKDLEVVGGEGSLQFKPHEVPTLEIHSAVNIGEVEGIANLKGEGSFQPDQTVWIEGGLEYTPAGGTPMKVDFSWADDRETRVLKTAVHNMGKEILALLSKPYTTLHTGTLNGKLTTFFQEGAFRRVEMEEVHLENLAGELGEIGQMTGEGILNFDNRWDVEHLALQINNGRHENFSEIEAAIEIKDNCLEPSAIFGKFNDVPGEAVIQGPLSTFHAAVKLEAGISQWLAIQKNREEPAVILEAAIDRHLDSLQITGTVTSLQDTITFQAESRSGEITADFQAALVHSDAYLPVLKIFAPDLTLDGDLTLAGHFSKNILEMKGHGQDLALKLSSYQLTIPGKSEPIACHYDFNQKQVSGVGKLSPLILKNDQHVVMVTEGELNFDDKNVVCRNLAARFGNIAFSGDLNATWEPSLRATFIAQRVQGALEDLDGPAWLKPFQGRFECPANGFQLQLEKQNDQFVAHYFVQAAAYDVAGPLTEQLSLKETEFQLTYNSLIENITLSEMHGVLAAVSGETVEFTSEIEKINHWSFNAAFHQGSWEILSLRGDAAETPHGYEVVVLDMQASGSYSEGPLFCTLDKNGTVVKTKGTLHLETNHLADQLKLAEQMGFCTLPPQFEERINHLHGTATLRLNRDDDRSNFEIQGEEISVGSHLFNAVHIDIENQGNEWFLRRCQLDDLKLKVHAAQQKDKWVIPLWEAHWNEMNVRGTAIYEKEKLDFQLDGSVSPRLYVKGSGLYVDEAFQEIALEVTDEQKPLALLACAKLIYKDGKWESPAVDATLFSSYLTTPLRSKLLFSCGNEMTFQGAAEGGETKMGRSTLKIGQIYGLYADGHLNLKCTTALDGEPIHLIGKLSQENQWAGELRIQKEDELLEVTLSDPTTIQKAQGNLLGLHLDIEREGAEYSGTARLLDGTYVADLFENDELRTMKGVRLHGKWTTAGGFKGEITGEEAVIKEMTLHEIRAHVDYSPLQFRLKNITLQDPAGTITIKECLGSRSSHQEKWDFSIPLLKGHDIKPSGLRKQGETTPETKPLLIRRLIMADIKGELGDLKTITGYGTFNFSQHVKKEPSFFDIPLSLLKDFGLDLDLFSPIMGEVSLQLKGGKCLFTHLENAYSEGKRSEFYLAEDPSYIDFQGRLALNFRMKQNVVLKLAEPFMIAVRGTWDKPKYSLK